MHENALQARCLGASPHQHNGPGVEEIDQQGHPPGPFVLAPVLSQKQGEQKDHAQGEEQVHAVVADPSGPAKQERLTSHQGQRQKKQPPGSFPDFFMPFSPGHHPSQTEEQRGQEDAVLV